MTAENSAEAIEIEAAKVEQSVKVYLEHDSVNRRWIVDQITMDGSELDGLDGPDVDLFPEYRTPELLAEIEAAAELPLPNAEELILLLLEALPEGSRLKDAMAEIRDAASNWANELTTYIAKASEEYRDTESAENQRDTAAAINAALELLGG